MRVRCPKKQIKALDKRPDDSHEHQQPSTKDSPAPTQQPVGGVDAKNKSLEIDLQQVIAFQTLLLGLGKSVKELVCETEKDRLLAEALTENKSLKVEISELRQRESDCQAQLEWEKNCCIGQVKKEEERIKEGERMKIEMSSLSFKNDRLEKELHHLRGQYTSMLNFNRDLQEALEEEDRKTKSRGKRRKRPRRRGGSS